MKARMFSTAMLLVMCAGVRLSFADDVGAADVVLFNTKVWTADERLRLAEAVAVKGSEIVAVGDNEEILKLRGPHTVSFDGRDRLVVPGFVDTHTHFENATEWFFEVRLMDVDNQSEMLRRLAQAVNRVPKGLWITGGDWGELAARDAAKKGNDNYISFIPDLAEIDAASSEHPVLFRRHDGNYFANSLALTYLRITRFTPDPGGGKFIHDSRTGELTGMLMGRAGDRAARALPPKSRKHTLIAARWLMKELNSYGLTGIHDIGRIDAISQQQLYRTAVERSFSDVSIFQDLRSEGTLTLKVNAMLPLSTWSDLPRYGITPGSGDEWIRFSALKAFIDGSMMFEPLDNHPDYAGGFTFRVESPRELHDDFLGADRDGWEMATHVIGDKAIAMYLDWLEEAIKTNGPRDRRPRLIHMEYPSLADIERAGNLHAFADITPFHMLLEVDQIEEKVGTERARSAFAGRTLIDLGIRVNLASDMPGDYYRFNENPFNPLVNIFMAVTRRHPGEEATRSWHPSEAISIEEGLRAYTINPAFAAHDENITGSVTVGKRADLVLLSSDVLSGTADNLLKTKVLLTLVNGKVVYRDSSP